MSSVYASAEEVASQIVGESAEMDRIADELLARAKANAARHEKDGTFERSLKVITVGGGKDRLIVATDPLAVPKELGHLLVRDGEQIGYVHGQYSLRNAMLEMPGK